MDKVHPLDTSTARRDDRPRHAASLRRPRPRTVDARATRSPGRGGRSVDELERLAPDAEALLVTSFVTIDGDLIGRLGNCRAIVRYGIGVNEVDVEAATGAGIPVGNVPDASVAEVADHTVMLALAALRRLRETAAGVAAGRWDVAPMRGTRRLSTLTAGILGLGRIGTAVAARLEAFGLTVVGFDPYVADSRHPAPGAGRAAGPLRPRLRPPAAHATRPAACSRTTGSRCSGPGPWS